MNYLAPIPAELRKVEYVKLYFYLEVVDTVKLPELVLLQLRRELLQALKTLPVDGECGLNEIIENLLKPSFSADPVAKKQHQKPAPAIVMTPSATCSGEIKLGQTVVLPVMFLGSGINAVGAFVRLMQHLGTRGLHSGKGKFFIRTIDAEGCGGELSPIEADNFCLKEFVLPICNLLWWLERQTGLSDAVKVRIATPLRVLSNGKPCFKLGFDRLFPFILRRITSMLSSHTDTELIIDPARLMSIAEKVNTVGSRLFWQDWRILQCGSSVQGVGGLMGELEISGENLGDLFWLLQLGTMFNCGKGAAYGAGQYRLIYS